MPFYLHKKLFLIFCHKLRLNLTKQRLHKATKILHIYSSFIYILPHERVQKKHAQSNTVYREHAMPYHHQKDTHQQTNKKVFIH